MFVLPYYEFLCRFRFVQHTRKSVRKSPEFFNYGRIRYFTESQKAVIQMGLPVIALYSCFSLEILVNDVNAGMLMCIP